MSVGGGNDEKSKGMTKIVRNIDGKIK